MWYEDVIYNILFDMFDEYVRCDFYNVRCMVFYVWYDIPTYFAIQSGSFLSIFCFWYSWDVILFSSDNDGMGGGDFRVIYFSILPLV